MSGSIEARLEEIRARIARAEARAGRAPGSVTLVAVSKTKPASDVRAAYAAGQRIFGENYVQELVKKAEELRDLLDLEWHFIGHLQRNKARDVLSAGAHVESVDNERLARELARRAEAAGARVPVLVQVNVGGEAQKSGCATDELPALLQAVADLDALELRGLMTIPPLDATPEESRPHFARLRALRDAHLGPDAWLSMGMSADLEVAVEEGATHVRVGSAIFGARDISRR